MKLLTLLTNKIRKKLNLIILNLGLESLPESIEEYLIDLNKKF